jgi:hypothetical protein
MGIIENIGIQLEQTPTDRRWQTTNMTTNNQKTTRKSGFFTAAFCAILGVIAAASSASAAVATMSWQPSPVDLNDLDHHSVYTWRIDNINVDPATITSATISFNNIRNWDSNYNVLHIHLLDTARFGGVASFIDDPTNSSPVTDFTDDFSNARYHGNSSWLVANGTADTFLKDKTFSDSAVDYTYTFSAAELTALEQYLAHGEDIALGFDPDCHYFNDGITFTLNFTPVPEVATMVPIALLLVAAIGFEIRRRRRATA